MTVRRAASLALVIVGAVANAGCGDDENQRKSLNVFAAASLTEAFTELGRAFEGSHPDVEVTFNFAASSALAQQINEGGPADVFVSADTSNMQKVVDAGNATNPEAIARNRLAILVEKGNPKGVTGLADLADPDITFVLCAPEVPCGKFGVAALQKAGVTAQPKSLAENVKAVVSLVTLGEVDAGIVYATDVLAAGDDAQGVDIDIASDPELEAEYPIAVTNRAQNLDAARAWVDFVTSAEGTRTLDRFGFLTP